MLRFKLAGGNELRAVSRDLKRAGGNIRADLAAELRDPTRAAYRSVRDAILDANLAGQRRNTRRRFPPGRGNRLPLRRPTAAALDWKVTTAGDPRAEVTFRPAKIPSRIVALFPYWIGQKDRLRHPVMGNRAVWVGQRLPDVWSQIRRREHTFRRAAVRAVDKAADTIAGRT